MKNEYFIYFIRFILNMLKDLDSQDKLLLYLLDRNSKLPLSSLAKQIKLSRESVLYRLNGYFRKGIIRNYLPVIDMGKIGYTHYKVFIKLSNITFDEEQNFLKHLIENSNVTWVGSCDGIYNLIFALRAKSSLDASTIVDKINEKYGKYIKQQDITTIVNATHYYRDYLIKDFDKTKLKQIFKEEIKWTEAKDPKELDDVDYGILDLLSRNVRTPSTEIATKLKVSPDTIILRIKRLEKQKILQHYTIWPNVNNLIGNYYKVLVNFKNINLDLEKRVLNFCRLHPNIVYVPKVFGPWQYEFDFDVESPDQLREFMRDFSNKFEENILEYNALNIYQEYKYRFFDIGAVKEKKEKKNRD